MSYFYFLSYQLHFLLNFLSLLVLNSYYVIFNPFDETVFQH